MHLQLKYGLQDPIKKDYFPLSISSIESVNSMVNEIRERTQCITLMTMSRYSAIQGQNVCVGNGFKQTNT